MSRIDALPAPLSELAPFLRSLAAGTLPVVPSDLPAELQPFLEQVLTAVREAQGG